MVNNYTEVLDSLMKEKKKKKKASKSEQGQFYQTWLEMVSEYGYDDHAEAYLYYGFGFCGASAFVKYLQQSDNPHQELLKLVGGKHFSEDSNTTFRVLMNTLALFLNEKAPEELIFVIMKYLPKACLNKEGKPLGTAPKSFEKYFLDVLNPSVELPLLSSFSAQPAVLNTFCTIISELLDETKKSSHSESGIIEAQLIMVTRWIDSYTESLLESSEVNQKSDKAIVEESHAQTLVEGSHEPPEKIIQTDSQTITKLEEKKSSADQISELLSQVKSLTLSMGHDNKALEDKNENLTLELSAKDQSIADLKAQLRMCAEQIEKLNEQLVAKEADKVMLVQEISKRDQVIQQKDKEIEERTKMTDILSRDRTRQSSEIVQKLASRIRVEYRDFADAEDLPMTCDLGENMRLQLQSVFDILEKGGMKIK